MIRKIVIAKMLWRRTESRVAGIFNHWEAGRVSLCLLLRTLRCEIGYNFFETWEAEHAQRRRITGLLAHRAFEFRVRGKESSLGRGNIALGAGGHAFAPGARKVQINSRPAGRDRSQSLGNRRRIAFAQREVEPLG